MFHGIITAILELIGLFSSFNKKADRNSRLEEDKALAEAIKNGDEETVGKIRERRKNYPNALIVLFVVGTVFVAGCSMIGKPHQQVVLTEGSKPYQLPAGDYQDSKGLVHREEIPRWSLSEADLFRDTQKLDVPKSSWIKDNSLPIVIFLILIMVITLQMIWLPAIIKRLLSKKDSQNNG